MNKELILNEIKRTAEANGGAPLGQTRFSQDTGIKVTDWHGKYWARWGSRILEYCKGQDSFDDVIALCAPVAEMQMQGVLAQALCGEADKGRMVFLVSAGDRSLQAAKVHVRASSRKPLGTHLIKLP